MDDSKGRNLHWTLQKHSLRQHSHSSDAFGHVIPRNPRKWAGKRDTSSFQYSGSVVSDSLPPHRLQHTRPPCPSPNPGVYSNSCSLSRVCHPTISSSVVPFSSWLQSFPASGSFPVSQFFTSGSQSIGVSASASVLPMNIQDWFPLGLTGSPGNSQESTPTQFKTINSSALSFLYNSTLTSIDLSFFNVEF